MPVQSWAHVQYWESGSTVVPVPPGPSRGGYPGWQASVVTPSLFGALGAWWDDWTTYLRAWWRLWRRIEALPETRRSVLLQTLEALEAPAYDIARRSVRTTATTLGFRNPASWVEYSRAIKTDQKQAENLWRRVRACQLTQQAWNPAQTSTSARLSNPATNLLVELAYQEYRIRPWGD